MKVQSSSDLIKRLSEGDPILLKMLYKEVFPKLKWYVRKNNGTDSDADEVFQEGLYQIMVRIRMNRLQLESTLEGYLFTVCKNLWLKELNSSKKKVRNDGVFELKAEDESTAKAILSQERWDLFEEKLEELSANCRELLRAYFSKVPYDVIVKKFAYRTENTAFQRVFKCKKRLMELIQKDSRYRALLSL